MRTINGWYIPEKEDLEERAKECFDSGDDSMVISVLNKNYRYVIIDLDIEKILSSKPEADKYIIDVCKDYLRIYSYNQDSDILKYNGIVYKGYIIPKVEDTNFDKDVLILCGEDDTMPRITVPEINSNKLKEMSKSDANDLILSASLDRINKVLKEGNK